MKLEELNIYLSDLSEEGKKKYFEFFGCTKEDMYGAKPEEKCYVASAFKWPDAEKAVKEFDKEYEALTYTD